MLVREKNSVINAVTNEWNRIVSSLNQKVNVDRTAAVNGFKTDSRIDAISIALEDAGMKNAEAVAWNVVTNETGYAYGATRPIWGSKSLFADIKAAADAIPMSTMKSFHVHSAYGVLDVALSTCSMKWPALQPHMFSLMADMGAAKSEAAAETAVLTFAKAIA